MRSVACGRGRLPADRTRGLRLGGTTSVTSVRRSGHRPAPARRRATRLASDQDQPRSAPHARAGRPPGAGPPLRGGASIAGCPLFPADNPWRQDISSRPVSPYSAAWVASVGARGTCTRTSGPTRRTASRTASCRPARPKVTITFTDYGDESDPGPYPIPADARVEAGGDAHVLVASGNCHIYELYGAQRSGSGWTAASGAVFDLALERAAAGRVDVSRRGRAADPARAGAAATRSGRGDRPCAAVHRVPVAAAATSTRRPTRPGRRSSSSLPPMGARFRLKASYDISRLPRRSRGSSCRRSRPTACSSPTTGRTGTCPAPPTPAGTTTDLNQLKTVPGSAFEAVDTGPIQH